MSLSIEEAIMQAWCIIPKTTHSVNCKISLWYHNCYDAPSEKEYTISVVPTSVVTEDNPVYRTTGENFEECLDQLGKIFPR